MKKILFALSLLVSLAETSAFAQQLIKQSESTAARRIRALYLVDVTDGYTPETAITIASNNDSDCADSTDECCISKNGGTPVYCAGTLTNVGFGAYTYEYTTGEVDTLGNLTIRINDSAARQFVGTDQVIAFDPYSAGVTVASGGIVSASVTDGALTSAKFAPDGTAQTGSTNTLTLASAESYADNALKDRQICITLGTGKGQCQVAASNVGSTDVVTFYNNWVITPDNTSQYVVAGSALANTNIWNGTAIPTGYTPGYPVVTIKDGTGAGEIDTNAGEIASCGSSGSGGANITRY